MAIEKEVPSNNAWLKEKIKEIISFASSQFSEDQKRDFECWKIYHGQQDPKKFQYLTQVEGFTYPARFRNVGGEIVRSKLNLLESKQSRRQFRFKAIAMDERSLQEKIMNRTKAYVKAIQSSYEERSALIDFQIQQVNDRLNDMRSQMEAQPENEEQAQQIQQIQQNFPLINLEFQKMIRALSREQLDTNDIQQKIKNYLQQTEQEIVEQIANASLKSSIQTDELVDHWNFGLRERIVTGKPSYITYYDSRKSKTVFKQIDSVNAFHSRGGNNKWTHRGEWCATLEHMDLMQMNTEFNLTDAEYNILKSYTLGDTTTLRNYVGNSAYFDAGDNHFTKHDKTEVWRVWYNVPRDVYYKESPNVYRPNEFHYNLINKDSKIKSNERKNKVVIYDQYYCVVLGNLVFINMGVNDHVYRSKDMPGLPLLPLVAKTFNKVSDKPSSMVYRVKDLIELYDIINYKKELAIALSGVKGMIMDKSQKPDSWSIDKWMYYRRLGTMWIETMKKGRKVPASFNQFQNYDDGLSESIQWFDYIQNGLENLISKIIGITPSAEGQFVSKDPVANVKMSNEQSALITEIIFADNDQVFSQALELFLNLKVQFEWKQGNVINYMNQDLEEVLVQIPNNLLNKADFRMYTSNNIKEDSMLEDIRQVAIQSWARQEIPINALVSLFKIDDLHEMENSLIAFAKQAEEIKQQSQENIAGAQERAKQQTLQLQAQIDSQMEQTRNQVEMAKLELDKAKFQFDQQKFQVETAYKQQELQVRSQLDSFKISSENEIESSYLQEEGRANRVQEQLRAFELKINAILNEMGIKAGEVQSIRKAEVDSEKNMRNKNNIKD